MRGGVRGEVPVVLARRPRGVRAAERDEVVARHRVGLVDGPRLQVAAVALAVELQRGHDGVARDRLRGRQVGRTHVEDALRRGRVEARTRPAQLEAGHGHVARERGALELLHRGLELRLREHAAVDGGQGRKPRQALDLGPGEAEVGRVEDEAVHPTGGVEGRAAADVPDGRPLLRLQRFGVRNDPRVGRIAEEPRGEHRALRQDRRRNEERCRHGVRPRGPHRGPRAVLSAGARVFVTRIPEKKISRSCQTHRRRPHLGRDPRIRARTRPPRARAQHRRPVAGG